MALETSGRLSLGDAAGADRSIAEEFGDSQPHSLSEFYGVDTGIPASGAISFSDFYGATAVPQPGYGSVVVSPATIDEDLTVAKITWNTTNLQAGTTVGVQFSDSTCTISDQSDVQISLDNSNWITPGNTQTLTLNGSVFELWVRAIEDNTTDGQSETFVAKLISTDSNGVNTGQASGTVTITDSSLDPIGWPSPTNYVKQYTGNFGETIAQYEANVLANAGQFAHVKEWKSDASDFCSFTTRGTGRRVVGSSAAVEANFYIRVLKLSNGWEIQVTSGVESGAVKYSTDPSWNFTPGFTDYFAQSTGDKTSYSIGSPGTAWFTVQRYTGGISPDQVKFVINKDNNSDYKYSDGNFGLYDVDFTSNTNPASIPFQRVGVGGGGPEAGALSGSVTYAVNNNTWQTLATNESAGMTQFGAGAADQANSNGTFFAGLNYTTTIDIVLRKSGYTDFTAASYLCQLLPFDGNELDL